MQNQLIKDRVDRELDRLGVTTKLHSIENKRALLVRIKYLMSKATVPNNWAWRELEDWYGLDGDYCDFDSGNEPE